MIPAAKKQSRIFDAIYTPPEPVHILMRYLRPDMTIWECAEGEKHITRELQAGGHKVIGTDIARAADQDFLFCPLPAGIDAIITNPPFSIKDEFLQRCYTLRLPFALLLPMDALANHNGRHHLYRDFGMQPLFLSRRVNYITGTGKKACWFNSVWITHGILDKPMEFAE
jgi:hypothetical protein